MRKHPLNDLDNDIRDHIERETQENVERGMTPEEARYAALRKFGNVALTKEDTRAVWIPIWLDHLWQDARYATRTFYRNPGFTAVIILTLALGVGANTAVFTLIDATLFRPAVWSDGGQPVWIAAVQGRSGRIGNMSYPDYLTYRTQATTLSAVVAYRRTGFAVGGSRPRRVDGALVSGNYFEVIGIRAALGRTFIPDDDALPGAHPVVVLGDALWRDHFGADPGVVGTTVSINGTPFTIVGVVPRGFKGAVSSEVDQLWMPLAMQRVAMPAEPDLLQAPDTRWLRVFGRLGQATTIAQAEAEMNVIAPQLNPAGIEPEREKSARVVPVRGGLNPYEQQSVVPILGLIAVVPVLVLLVACANVANVLMARNVSRRKELAMRQAIGASRGRVIRLQLTESLLLAFLAAGTGFTVSFGLIALIARIGNVPADAVALFTPDARALLATTVVAMAATIIFGVAPAFASAKRDVLDALKSEGVTSTEAASGGRLRRVFIVAQVAVSLVLLIAAGLLLQSLSKALRVDPGFDPRNAVTASFDLGLQGYTASRRHAFVAQFIERTSAISGVTSVAVTTSLPFSGNVYGTRVFSESATQPVPASVASVTPRYFETMRIPLDRGRDFSSTDSSTALPVAIVNESLAQRLWPAMNPVGQRLRLSGENESWLEVVGVAGDTKSESLTESAHDAYYVPLQQHPDSHLTVVMRTTAAPPEALSCIEKTVRGLDPDLPLFDLQTLEDAVRQDVNLRRASVSLLGVFGSLALLLAAIGIYGVTSHSVSRRIREVGIRVSLGARAIDVFQMFIVESVRVSLIGVAIGLAITAVVSRLMTTFLFGLTAIDTLTFLSAAAILCLVAVVASFIPARRAARVDPLVALRYD